MSHGRAVRPTPLFDPSLNFIPNSSLHSVSCIADKPKDLGIPNSFPYKDQVLAEAAAEKQQVSLETLGLLSLAEIILTLSLLFRPRRRRSLDERLNEMVPLQLLSLQPLLSPQLSPQIQHSTMRWTKMIKRRLWFKILRSSFTQRV